MPASPLKSALEFYSLSLPYHPGKWRVIEWMLRAGGIEARDQGETFTVTREGLRWRLSNRCCVQRALYYHGCIDRFASQALLQHAVSGSVFLDVGSYFGYYALRAASQGARAFAFEPMPGNYELLRTQADLNSLPNLETIPAAVAAEAGRVRFELPQSDNLGRGHIVTGADVVPNTIEVETVALDDFLAQRGIDQVAAMKIDVEGAELAVLAGARELFGRCRPVILVEVNAPCLERFGASSAALLQELRRLGYDLFRVEGRHLKPFGDDLVPGEDYTNALCLPRKAQ